MRKREIKYMMLYPAKLKIIAEGKSWLLATPEEVWESLEGWRVVASKSPKAREQSQIGSDGDDRMAKKGAEKPGRGGKHSVSGQ